MLFVSCLSEVIKGCKFVNLIFLIIKLFVKVCWFWILLMLSFDVILFNMDELIVVLSLLICVLFIVDIFKILIGNLYIFVLLIKDVLSCWVLILVWMVFSVLLF